MSRVDDRVVSMKFDNRQFESGVKQSISTLDRLKNALKFDKATQSLDDLGKTAGRFTLNGMERSVETVNAKFSALGVIGFEVLRRMTSAAIDFGSAMVSSVINPLVEGGQKRAQNIEAANFQFKGLGMNVEKTMASANAAVKGTAYGLDVAAKTASQLGASGLRAGKDMTSALRGISGVAAMTNSSYEDIADIFTTVAGNGKLMSSELNRLSARGMNAAATLGQSLGKTESQVRDMTSKGKISFAMFYTAMDKAFGAHATKANETYTGSLSNLNAALSRVSAPYYTAKFNALRDVFNALSPQIDKANKAISPLVDTLGKLMMNASGQAVKFINSLDFTPVVKSVPYLSTALTNLFMVINQIKNIAGSALKDLIPKDAENGLIVISKALSELTGKLRMNAEQANDLKRAFTGLFTIVHIAWTILQAAVRILDAIFQGLGVTGSGVLKFAGNLGDAIVKFDQFIQTGKGFNNFLTGLTSGIQSTKQKLKDFGTAVGNAMDKIKAFFQALGSKGGAAAGAATKQVDNFVDRLRSKFSILGKLLELGRKFAHGIILSFKPLMPIFLQLGMAVEKGMTQLQQGFQKAVLDGSVQHFVDLINSLLTGGLIVGIKKFVDSLTDLKESLVGKMPKSQITTILDAVKDSMAEMQAKLKADQLKSIAIAIGILAAAVLVLSLIDSGRLTSSLTAMTVMLGQMLGALTVMTKYIKPADIKNMTALSTNLILLAVAVDLMAVAVAKLGGLSWNELAKGLTGLAVSIGLLVAAMNLMPKDEVVKSAGSMIILAVAVNILASAVQKMGDMSWEELSKGLLGLVGIMASLVSVTNLMNPEGLAKTATGLISMAVAVRLMASAVALMGGLSWEELSKGLLGLAGVLAAMTAAMNLMPAESMMKNAAAMVIISAGLLVLAAALKSFASMSLEDIYTGLIGMASSLLVLTAALNNMQGSIGGAAAMVVAAAAMVVLGAALKIFASMSIEQLATSIIGLAAALVVMGVAANAMTGAIMGAAALMVMALALSVLVPPLMLLGTMDLASLGTAILGLAAIFLIFGLAGMALTPVAPTLMAVAGAIALFGLGVLAAGAGLLMLSAGFTGLSVSIVAFASAFVSAITIVIGMIPMIVMSVVTLIKALAMGIAQSGVAVTAAMVTVLMSLIKATMTILPAILAALTRLVVMMVNTLVMMVPFLVNAGMKLVLGILKGIRDHIGQIVTVALEIIANFINGISRGLPQVVTAAANLIITFVRTLASTIRTKGPELRSAAGELARAIIDGMISGLKDGVKLVADEAMRVARGALNAAKSALGIKSPSREFKKVGLYSDQGLVNGLKAGSKGVERASADVADTALSTVRDYIKDLGDGVLDEMSGDPVIKPVIDLSDVQKGANDISSILNGTPTLNFAQSAIATPEKASSSNSGDAPGSQSGSYSFVQNNYSPKALSRLDIYRDTKNLVSTVKGALK